MRITRLLAAVCLASAFVAAPVAQANHLEAKLYVITNWPGSGSCSANDVSSWDDMTFAWYNAIGDGPVFFKDGSWTNGNLSRQQFCDPDSGFSPCDDDKRVDEADAAMIALHGSDHSKHWDGSLLVASGGDCKLHGPEGASTDALFVGDYDLEFLHISSCLSMDDDNINTAKRLFADVDSPSNGQRLHQADGFHGVMAISSGRADDYEDFADDAHYVSIADAWTDNMYDEDITYNTGASGDQCPVALTIGSSPADALTRLFVERYSYILSDPASNSWIAYQFYDGCDPVAETPFVDPNS
jgi:hypothetical protein